MKRKKIPLWLRRQALDFCTEAYTSNTNGFTFDETEGAGGQGSAAKDNTIGETGILTLFSPYLRATMGYHNFGPTFRQIPVFAAAPPDFLGRLALCLRPVAFGAGEYCFVAGDISKQMFLLVEGRVQVSNHTYYDILTFITWLIVIYFLYVFLLLYVTMSYSMFGSAKYGQLGSMGETSFHTLRSRAVHHLSVKRAS